MNQRKISSIDLSFWLPAVKTEILEGELPLSLSIGLKETYGFWNAKIW